MRKTSNLEASRTINYKDALTITGRLDVIQEFPLIPGVVTACGLALPKFELPGATMSPASLHETVPTSFRTSAMSVFLIAVREGGRMASGLPSAFHRHDRPLGPHPQPTGTRSPRGTLGL